MKKSSSFSNNMRSFPSPDAPNYREKRVLGNNPKGSCSERIPKPKGNGCIGTRRHHTMGGLTPFNSRRTRPSKWDEAERWICSPSSVSSYGNSNSRISHGHGKFHQHRIKSISGPIMPHGEATHYSNYCNSSVPLHQGLVVRNLMVGSPFSTGVLVPVVSVHHYDQSHDDVDDDAVFGYDIDNNGLQYSSSAVLSQNFGVGLAQSSISNAHTCSELQSDSLSSNPQDEKHEGTKNKDRDTSFLSRCDKGTQMSSSETENDAHSSPIIDVEVDSETTLIKWAKRHATKLTKKDSLHSKHIREESIESKASSWDVVESTLDSSKLQREEAKINAWENLQKAKAEAAIRKLEMKLEKKKSSSIDKIMNKVKRAEMKAENMRSSLPAPQGNQVSKICKVFSLPKHVHMWSPSICFGSHAE
ncbi:PREDICTED: uncharacterized protein LOC109330672 [Lupinus angustifolius]|uniref:uncharacterized protein LOC109330672 n=1 Tax=Lupinus angustifolius TaxID=3871 RepID=UPI00092E6235|nr:PREDICTED: uncharacterized protein LOC109330672 [Lupinus angustifolius]